MARLLSARQNRQPHAVQAAEGVAALLAYSNASAAKIALRATAHATSNTTVGGRHVGCLPNIATVIFLPALTALTRALQHAAYGLTYWPTAPVVCTPHLLLVPHINTVRPHVSANVIGGIPVMPLTSTFPAIDQCHDRGRGKGGT